MKQTKVKRILARVLTVLAVLAAVFLLLGSTVSRLLIDYWWFGELGQESTWGTLWSARLVPASIGFVLVLLFLVVQVLVARWARADGGHPTTEEEVVIARALATIGNRTGLIWSGLIGLIALIAASQVGSRWSEWLLFRNSTPFGVKDPQFGKDIGFYVFELPWWKFVADWAFGIVLVSIAITLIAHYLYGGIRVQRTLQRTTTAVKIHVSVLLALAASIKAAQYWLGQYELVHSDRGVVRGASATDIAASLPGLQLMVVVASISAILFLLNIRRGGVALPVLATVLIIGVRLVVGVAYPLGYQQFKVSPNELSAERTYIERNIESTRAAFGISEVSTQKFTGDQELQQSAVEENREVFDLARVWDPSEIRSNFVQDQQFATYYSFVDGDVDRYTIDGKQVPVVVSARELAPNKLPSKSWLNEHLVYTHGYGMVIAPSNEVDTDGGPSYLVDGVPPKGMPKISNPAIYFGDTLEGFAVVDTKVKEFDYPQDENTKSVRYQGKAGVRLDSFIKKLAFSVNFADTRLLISSEIDDDSRIIINRGVRERAKALAPFLSFDSDPYPVADNGGITWVLDAYTTTTQYPYSQTYTGTGGLSNSTNYVRNSVKVTMDAYDGTMKLYAIDDKDPILRAWRNAFPEVFTDGKKMPQNIREHLRYPEDLFRLQTEVYGKYHVTDETAFYNDARRWEVADDPGSGVVKSGSGSSGSASNAEGSTGAKSSGSRIDPYYLLTKRPGSDKVEFLLVRPFVPVSNDELSNLAGFMAASSDPDEYGKLTVYELPSGTSTAGPSIVNSRINGDQEISKTITLLGNRGTGSEVLQGSLQLLPVQDALVYVRPYYVQNTEGRALARFSFVVVYANGKAAAGDTVNDALEKLGLASPTDPVDPGTSEPKPAQEEGEPGETPEETPGEVPATADLKTLLQNAQDAFADAEVALQAGDLGAYQAAVKKAQAAVEQAFAAQGNSDS